MAKGVGPVLGGVGTLVSTIDSIFDKDGYTTGDAVKTAVGVLGILAAFNPVTAPIAATYALADLAVGLATGYSITDRIGTAIDTINK